MPRSGEVGEQIFEQVEKLVAGGMNRTEAFAKISADSGRRAGTVAANYYRVARKRAATAVADIDALAKSLVDSVQALAEAVKSQAAEVGKMRKKLDGVKKMLD